MAIPISHQGKYVYHFTHVENLDSIIRHGLLATNVKGARKISHRNVAAASIQARRSEMVVPCGPGGTVHDYVPFYFCSVNPMLLSVLNAKNVDQQLLVFLCVNIDILLRDGSVFTDASANTQIPPAFYDDPADLDELDWTVINSRKWRVSSDGERHRRMAELLIHDRVDIKDIAHIVVWNESIHDLVLKAFEGNNVAPPMIGFEPFHGKYFYFTKFQLGKETESLVTGPYFFKQAFESTVVQIHDNRASMGSGMAFPFHDIGHLIEALAEDFTAISEMADIFELEVEYAGRNHVVSDHTGEVVGNIKKDRFYRSCHADDKKILLLSAYLHDIGKAPFSIAEGKTHQVYADYPKDSLEKLIRLLTEEVGVISDNEIRKICLLVGYHDLVADIILRHRDEEQLFDLITDETELDMLIAMSIAGINDMEFFEKTKVKNGARPLRQKAMDRLDGM